MENPTMFFEGLSPWSSLKSIPNYRAVLGDAAGLLDLAAVPQLGLSLAAALRGDGAAAGRTSVSSWGVPPGCRWMI